MDQRYTRFRNNTILVIIGNIGSKLMSFIMLPFYTRWLPIEGYGTVDIINIYVSFLIWSCDMCYSRIGLYIS